MAPISGGPATKRFVAQAWNENRKEAIVSTRPQWLKLRTFTSCLLPYFNCYGHWSGSFFETTFPIEHWLIWQSESMWMSRTLSLLSMVRSRRYPE